MPPRESHDAPVPRLMRYLPGSRFLGDFVAEVPLRRPSDGLNGDCLEILAAATRVAVQRVRWHFPGGQAQICTPAGPARIVERARSCDVAALLGADGGAAIEEVHVDTVRRALAGCARWSPDQWDIAGFSAFAPRRSTGTESRVAAADADFFELGGSVDDKVPYRTLRLGRVHDEIVDDHSWHWSGPPVRQIVVLEVLDASTARGIGSVERQFGPEVARVAAWFVARRSSRFS